MFLFSALNSLNSLGILSGSGLRAPISAIAFYCRAPFGEGDLDLGTSSSLSPGGM